MTKKSDSSFKKHELVEAGYHCPVCNKVTKWYSHVTDTLVGDSLECKTCHNYIIYVLFDLVPGVDEFEAATPCLTKWKDEIYTSWGDKDVSVIRNIEDNVTLVSVDDGAYIKLNHVLEFTSIEQLNKRLESIIVFS